MKNKLYLTLKHLCITVVLFTSFGKLPQAEIDAANQAIEEAKQAGADLYVPNAFTGLQDSMNIVMEGIEAQKSKFFKNYSNSKEQLARMAELAKQVKTDAETKKEELKTEIQNTLADIKTLLEDNQKLIAEAPRGKEGTAALVAIKMEISAIDKVKAAKEKAISINAELKEVIAKYKKNVQSRRT